MNNSKLVGFKRLICKKKSLLQLYKKTELIWVVAYMDVVLKI